MPTPWDKTRLEWLKEIRLQEPTWEVRSRAGQVLIYIEVRVKGQVYHVYPARHGGGYVAERPWTETYHVALMDLDAVLNAIRTQAK